MVRRFLLSAHGNQYGNAQGKSQPFSTGLIIFRIVLSSLTRLSVIGQPKVYETKLTYLTSTNHMNLTLKNYSLGTLLKT